MRAGGRPVTGVSYGTTLILGGQPVRFDAHDVLRTFGLTNGVMHARDQGGSDPTEVACGRWPVAKSRLRPAVARCRCAVACDLARWNRIRKVVHDVSGQDMPASRHLVVGFSPRQSLCCRDRPQRSQCARAEIGSRGACGAADQPTLNNEVGFIIVHRCSTQHLLLACTWREGNELWETVWEDTSGTFVLLDRPSTHLPTYCVWEMGVVAHETRAWRRVLNDGVHDGSLDVYINDSLLGDV